MKGKTMNTINRSAVIPFAILAMWATNGASSALAEQSAQPAFASAGVAVVFARTCRGRRRPG